MVDFIGIGAQRCATSWLYSCMYEHPEICAPEKEIHFFSRPRYEEKGIEWYKKIFESRCPKESVKGEYSTSYLYDARAADRIYKDFPDTKIIVSLRNPVERAASQYALHAKVGWLKAEEVSFDEFIQTEKSALEQGMYSEQLNHYFKLFSKNKIHIVIKERIDNEINKPEVIREVFKFLGVDSNFTPSLLYREINTNKVPKRLWIDRSIQYVANFMYKHGMDKQVFAIKKVGLPAAVRNWNSAGELNAMSTKTKKQLTDYFREDVKKVSELTGIDVYSEWGF